jgi:hypothetical protein
MFGDAKDGADDDVVSDVDDADDAADDADDATDNAADEDVDVCLAPGSISDADDLDYNCWNSLGGARELCTTARNTLHAVHALLLHHSISHTAQNTWIPRGPAPVSCWSRNIVSKPERACGQSHLREGR